MTLAADLSKVSHYWTFIGTSNYAVTGATPTIGTDLTGAVLNPGDWLQIANRGTVTVPDLHWVTIGGDLLAKARADRLFGLQPWSAAAWEQGALTLFQGDIYRASRPIAGTDPSPSPTVTPLDLALSGTTRNDLTGSGLDTLHPAPSDGDVERATAGGTIASLNVPFSGHTYAANDGFVYTSDPRFAGQGTTQDGFAFDQGWISVGQMSPIADPLRLTPQPAASPWQRLDISGGLKVAQDDSQLPQTAPGGQVWIVLSSAQAGNKQALFGYDQAAAQWQQLGGNDGTGLDLTGGTVIYPKSLFYPGVPPTNLSQLVPQPSIVGDTLWCTNDAGYPVEVAVSKDGTTWTANHPSRLDSNLTGANRPAKADYPTQLLVGMASGQAKITHIANRSRDWVPVAEPVIPPAIRAEKAKTYVNATRSDMRAIYSGLRLSGLVYARSPTIMFLVLGGTQLTGGRRCDITYDYDLHLLKEGTYDYTLVGDMGFGSNGMDGRVQMAWDDTNNRIQQATVARYDISLTVVGGRVLFAAELKYRRVAGNRHTNFITRGFLYGANVSRVTLAGIGFTNAADFNMNSHLMGEW
jgi:hypothetical protein